MVGVLEPRFRVGERAGMVARRDSAAKSLVEPQAKEAEGDKEVGA